MTALLSVRTWAEMALLQTAIILAGVLIEYRGSARPPNLESTRRNVLYAIVVRAIYDLLHPVTIVLTGFFVNTMGGGLVVLPNAGWGLLWAIPVYVLVMDGLEYAFHRAQHRFAFLWALHSLHHSDQALNISTAPRHFWGELLIKSASIYALAGMLFQANATVTAVYIGMGVYNYVLHMNVRLGFGRFAALLNSPQFHRLHHSALPQHFDCNFNQFFPIFDLLGGTYRRPEPDEFAPTGLVSGEQPASLWSMLTWPWQYLSRQGVKADMSMRTTNS